MYLFYVYRCMYIWAFVSDFFISGNFVSTIFFDIDRKMMYEEIWTTNNQLTEHVH